MMPDDGSFGLWLAFALVAAAAFGIGWLIGMRRTRARPNRPPGAPDATASPGAGQISATVSARSPT